MSYCYPDLHAQGFTAWGLLSGLFFVLSIAHAFLSINLLDNVAAATGIWCGVAMLVSFAFGVATGDHVGSPVLAAMALVGMLLGVAGITAVYQQDDGCAALHRIVSHQYCAFAVPSRQESALLCLRAAEIRFLRVFCMQATFLAVTANKG